MLMRTLRFGLMTTVVAWAGIQALLADEPAPVAATPPAATTINLTYQGVPFDQWLTDFRTELEPVRRRECLTALVAFGRNGKAEVVVPHILDLLDGYPTRTTMLLAGEFDEGSEEIQKPISEGRLPEGFGALGFTDVDDLKLFLTANRSLSRLTPRATPLIVKHVTDKGSLSASRIVAMRVLATEATSEWLRLLPQLVTRDSFTCMINLHYFGQDNFLTDEEAYETCVKKLLEVKASENLPQVIYALAENRHHSQRKLIRPLLEELQKKSKDEKVHQAIRQALSRIPIDPEEKSQVVPASVKE